MHSFSENFEVRYVGDAVVAGSSIDDNSTRIDVQDYETVTFMVPVTDSVDTGVAALTIQGNDIDSDTGMTAITGAIATVTSASNDDLNGKVLMVEVRNPATRYIQAVRTSATANIAYGTVTAILKPHRVPVTADSTIAASAYVQD